jgi:hypothetical protein
VCEFESAEKQYFPRVGDSKKVLQQKARNRRIVSKALAAEAGPALAEIRKSIRGNEVAPAPSAIAEQQDLSPQERLAQIRAERERRQRVARQPQAPVPVLGGR